MIDRRIKFRHIQCFVEICREGSLKAAAQKLFLTQPAISKSLRELEEILGHTLLLRDRSGIELTNDGELFLRHAKTSLASISNGIEGLKRSEDLQSEVLSIGVLPSVAARLIPEVAERFFATDNNTVLTIADGPVGYLIERLKLGELDLVIGRMGNYNDMKGVYFNVLYRERISFIVRADHPILDAPSLDQIADWPVVYPSKNSAIRPIVDQFCVENGIALGTSTIETVSGAFGRVHVEKSDAIWIISDGVVVNEIERGALARLPFNTETTLGAIGTMSREDWSFTPAAKRFRASLREVSETYA